MGLDDLIPDVLKGESPAQDRIRQGFAQRGAFGGALNALTEIPSLAGDVAGAAQDFLPGIGDFRDVASAFTGSIDGFELTPRQRLAAGLGGALGVAGLGAARGHHLRRTGQGLRGEAGNVLFGPSRLHALPGKTGSAADPRYRQPALRGQIILDANDFEHLAEMLGAPKLAPVQRVALAGFYRAFGQKVAQLDVHREAEGSYGSPDAFLLGSATAELSKFDHALDQGLFDFEGVKPLLDTYEALRSNPLSVIGDPERLDPLLKFMSDFAELTQEAVTPELYIAPHVSLYGVDATPEGPRTMVHYAAEALPTAVDEKTLRDRMSRWDYEKSIPLMVENLLRMKGLTRTVEQIADDIKWYPRANTIAHGFKQEFDVTLAQASGVLSAFSPQAKWDDTVRFAREFLATRKKPEGAPEDSFEKALRIMQGDGSYETVRAVFVDSKTLKTHNFFDNIYDPFSVADDVTVDTHQFDAAMGFRTKGPDDGSLPRDKKGRPAKFKAPIFEKQLPGSRAYEAAKTAHRLAAQIEGLARANMLQALVWVESQELKLHETRPLPEGASGPGMAGKRSGRYVVSDNIWNALHGRSSPTLAELIRDASDDDAPDVRPPSPRDDRDYKNLSARTGVVVVSEPNGLVSVLGEVTDVVAESTRTLYPLPVDDKALLARWVPLRARVVKDVDDLVGAFLSEEALSKFAVLERHTDPTGYPALASGNHFILKTAADKRSVLDAFESEAGVSGNRHAGISRAETTGDQFEKVSASAFHKAALAAAKATKTDSRGRQRSVGETVYVYSRAEYGKMRTFLSEDGLTGFAVKPDGDLVSVFNVGQKGAGEAAVIRGIAEGASKLDAFDESGFLPRKYAKFGFQEDRRQPWDPEQAPPGWQGDKPDVVYMKRDPGSRPPVEWQTQEALHIDLGDNPDPELVARLWAIAERLTSEGTAVSPSLYLHGGGVAPAGAQRVVEHHFADAHGKGHVMHRGASYELGNENGVFVWVPESEAKRYKPSQDQRFKTQRSRLVHSQADDGSIIVDNELRLLTPASSEVQVVVSEKDLLRSKLGPKLVRNWALQLSAGDDLPTMAIGRSADETGALMAEAGADPGRTVVGTVTWDKNTRVAVSIEAPTRRLGLEAVAALRRAGVDFPVSSYKIVTPGAAEAVA